MSSLAFAQWAFINQRSGKALEVGGFSLDDGAQVQQWGWLSGSNQRWNIVDVGDGYYKIVNVNSGKVLEVGAFSLDNDGRVQQWGWVGGLNQQWSIVPQQPGYYSIVNRNSGKVLDVAGYSLDDGGIVHQWDWLNGDNQLWSVVAVSDSSTTPASACNAYAAAAPSVIFSTDYYDGYTAYPLYTFSNSSYVGAVAAGTCGFLYTSFGTPNYPANISANLQTLTGSLIEWVAYDNQITGAYGFSSRCDGCLYPVVQGAIFGFAGVDVSTGSVFVMTAPVGLYVTAAYF